MKRSTAMISRAWAVAMMLAVALAIPSLAFALTPPVPFTDPVEVTGGRVKGVYRDGGAVFAGIPYARPPIGDLRWRPPQPVEAWKDVLQATGHVPACLQSDLGWNKDDAYGAREDCLYLNVSTPDLRPRAKLPVIVWIHGGANWAGSSGGIVHSSLLKRGVVLVAIQYRLGVFGFLSHPALTAEQGGASGNYALMDQIAALQWVRANIDGFGGDPDNVTIAGESAGGEDVGLLQLSPLAQGLFAKAIQESGTAGFGLPPRSLSENEAVGLELARLAGAPDGPGALAALRAMPGQQLLAAQAKTQGPSVLPNQSFLWLQATVDGRVLDMTPEQALAEGRASRPVLLGSNAREIGFYDGLDLPAAVKRTYGETGVRALELYGADPQLGEVAMQVATDVMFRCASTYTAKAAVAAGASAWLYQFDLSQSGPVSHASELVYVFNPIPVGGGASLQAYWVNFARTGDPNGEGLPVWPHFGSEHAYLAFEPSGPEVRRDLRGPICAKLGRP